jgi:hypothetical protein
MFAISGRSRALAMVIGVLAASLLTLGLVAPAEAAKRTVLKNEFGTARSSINGTFGKNGTVTGSFTPRKFRVNQAGDLVAVGKLRAKLVRGNGKVVGNEVKTIRIPVRKIEGVPVGAAGVQAAATCDILNLVLGPLSLDLLGLQVDLNRVVLNIVAATGAGNLLGNLLCAVAGLLDGGGLLTQVSQILNSILGILRL